MPPETSTLVPGMIIHHCTVGGDGSVMENRFLNSAKKLVIVLKVPSFSRHLGDIFIFYIPSTTKKLQASEVLLKMGILFVSNIFA